MEQGSLVEQGLRRSRDHQRLAGPGSPRGWREERLVGVCSAWLGKAGFGWKAAIVSKTKLSIQHVPERRRCQQGAAAVGSRLVPQPAGQPSRSCSAEMSVRYRDHVRLHLCFPWLTLLRITS